MKRKSIFLFDGLWCYIVMRTKGWMATTAPFSKGGHCVGHRICKFWPRGYIPRFARRRGENWIRLERRNKRVEEPGSWFNMAVRQGAYASRSIHVYETDVCSLFPLRNLSSRVARRGRYPPCLSKILSLFADVPPLGLLSWTNHLDGKEISRGRGYVGWMRIGLINGMTAIRSILSTGDRKIVLKF